MTMTLVTNSSLEYPFGALMDDLKRMAPNNRIDTARAHPGVQAALTALIEAIAIVHRKIEIAEQKWLIDKAREAENAATERLKDLRQRLQEDHGIVEVSP
jgi:hypothetical protein